MFKSLAKMTTPKNLDKRFLDEAERLIGIGKAGSYAEIADAIGWDKTSITNVKKGRRPIPLAVYKRFTEHYKIQPEPEPSLGSTARDQKIIDLLEDQNKTLRDQLNSMTGELRHIAVMNYAMIKGMRKAVAKILAKVDRIDPLEVAQKLDKETAAFYRSARERGSLIDLDI